MIYLALWRWLLKELGKYDTNVFEKVRIRMNIFPDAYRFLVGDNIRVYFQRGKKPVLNIFHRKNPSSQYNIVLKRDLTPQIIDEVTNVLENIKKCADQIEESYKSY